MAMNTERIEELRAEITKVAARIAHLDTEARQVETGEVERKRKFDPDGSLLGHEESESVHHSEAVGYWREVRESEKRLDELRAELARLTDAQATHAVEVHMHFDGPPAP
jgi:chromosome segregation ATPase